MSEEAIAKIKLAKANISDETRKKMSESKVGRTPWNKGLTADDPRVAKYGTRGIHPSEESKEKMRKAKEGVIPWNKGLTKSDPRIAKSAERMMGVPKTKEHCINMSLGKLGIKPWNNGLTKTSDERVLKNTLSMTETKIKQAENGELNIWTTNLTADEDERIKLNPNGYKGLTKETSEKIKQATDKQSQTMKELYSEGEIEIWNKGLNADSDPRMKQLAETLSETRNQLFAEGLIEVWNKGTEGLQDAWNKGLTKHNHTGMMKVALARINYMANNKGTFISSHEQKVADFIGTIGLEKGIDYFQQFYITDIEDKYLSDIYIPKLKLVIEIDGVYWHTFPGRLETDIRRTNQLRDKGYLVFRFTDKQVEKEFEFIKATLIKLLNKSD